MPNKQTLDGVDTLTRQFSRLIAGVIAVFLVPFIIYVFYLDRRLTAFEETLQHLPPQELESHDVDRGEVYHLTANPVAGQLVYVPAYSHIYHADGKPYLLTITLSVRNTSVEEAIVVKSIRYFDTKGNEVKSYLDKPVRLPALATTEVIVERDDATGGSGANFLVEWYSSQLVTEPIVEAVMVDTQGQQGISFARRGSVISQAVSDVGVDQFDSSDAGSGDTATP